jgi:hypothetical protein
MIIDFRLHTSDNALTENGVQIAVYSVLLFFLPSPTQLDPSCRHFHVITFHINASIAIVVFDNVNAFIISFLCARVAAAANSFRKLCKHFPRCNTN